VILVEFAEKLSRESTPNQCYLLSALYNLAEAAGLLAGKKMTRAVALSIFFIGFVHEDTRDTGYKDSKNLLSSIVAINEGLLSELLAVYDIYKDQYKLEDETTQLELWETLPLAKWTPTSQDFKILKNWLLSEVSSVHCQMARWIFMHLNYHIIGHKAQNQIARIVVKSYSQSFDPKSAQFTWNLLFRLRLHIVDRGGRLEDVPFLTKDADLGLLVSQSVCPAIYVALETTSVGHSVPVIFNQGFKMIRTLFDNQKYEATFICIDHVTSMFSDCIDSLVSCEDFLTLITDIVSEESYIKTAKTLITQGETRPHLRKFEKMLHSHLERETGDCLWKLVGLWGRVLTNLPSWQHNSGVVYLLDVVCQWALLDSVAWLEMSRILESALEKITVEPRSPISAFLRIGTDLVPTLLPYNCNGSAPWFAYAALTVEYQVFEKKTGLWGMLLRELWQLRESKAKTNIDAALKKVCVSLKLPIRKSSQLSFYKWSAQILEMPVSHPLNIIVWANFLELFVMRVPGLVIRGSPADRFFHGIANTNLLNKLMQRLTVLSESDQDLSGVYQTIKLWFGNQLIVLNPSNVVANLPAEYNSPLLNALINSQLHQWYSLMPLASMREKLTDDARTWPRFLGRSVKSIPESPSRKFIPPDQRMSIRLREFMDPICLQKPSDILLVNALPKFEGNVTLIRQLSASLMLIKNIIEKANRNASAVMKTTGSLYRSKTERVVLRGSCYGSWLEINGANRKIPCKGEASMTHEFLNWLPDWKQQRDLEENINYFKGELLVLQGEAYLAFVVDFMVLRITCGHLEDKEIIAANPAVGKSLFHSLIDIWRLSDQVSPQIATLIQDCMVVSPFRRTMQLCP